VQKCCQIVYLPLHASCRQGRAVANRVVNLFRRVLNRQSSRQRSSPALCDGSGTKKYNTEIEQEREHRDADLTGEPPSFALPTEDQREQLVKSKRGSNNSVPKRNIRDAPEI